MADCRVQGQGRGKPGECLSDGKATERVALLRSWSFRFFFSLLLLVASCSGRYLEDGAGLVGRIGLGRASARKSPHATGAIREGGRRRPVRKKKPEPGGREPFVCGCVCVVSPAASIRAGREKGSKDALGPRDLTTLAPCLSACLLAYSDGTRRFFFFRRPSLNKNKNKKKFRSDECRQPKPCSAFRDEENEAGGAMFADNDRRVTQMCLL